MTRNATLVGALGAVLVAALVALQFRVGVTSLVGGSDAYHFEDIDAFFLPLWRECARAWASKRVPVWTEHAWSGLPLLGDPQTGALYPLHVAVWTTWPRVDPARMYAALIVAHAIWAALGMFALCRARGRTVWASMLAALSLGLGGYLALEVRHVHFVEAIAWVPWIAWACHRLQGQPTFARSAGLAVCVAMAWATGGVSTLFYAAGVIAVLVVARLRGRALALACLGGAIGTLLAWPVLAPTWLHVAWSPRAQGTQYAFASSMSWPGFSALPSLFVPNYYGQTVLGTYRGGGTQWEIAGYYAGILPFALAIFALVRAMGRDGVARRERLGFALLFLVAIALALGDKTPLHPFLYAHLPLFDSMRCPARALVVFSLSIPLLAAEGLDALVVARSLARRRALVVALIAATAIDLLMTHRRENPASALAPAIAREAHAFVSDAARVDDRFIQDVHLPQAAHNLGLAWGLQSAGGYSSLPIWRYLHLLWINNHGRVYPHTKLADDLSAQGIWRWDTAWVDALAIRWVIAQTDPDGDSDHYVRRTHALDGVDVYENTRAYPRAWMVHRARVVADERAAAEAIADPSFDPRREVVLEGATPALTSTQRPEPVAISRRDQAFVYDVTVDAPGVLVMAEPIYRGWRASIDGRPTELRAADLALRGIVLDAGTHHVEVRLDRRALLLGW